MKVFKYAIFKAFIADNYSIQIIDGVEKLVFKQALKVKNMMTERKSGGWVGLTSLDLTMYFHTTKNGDLVA